MGVGIDTSLLHKLKFFLERGILISGADETVFDVTADSGTEKSGFLRYKTYTKLSGHGPHRSQPYVPIC